MKTLVRPLLVLALCAVLAIPGSSTVTAGGDEGLILGAAIEEALESSPMVELAEVRGEKARLELRQARDMAREISDDVVQSYQVAVIKYLYPSQARTARDLAEHNTVAVRENLDLAVQTTYRGLQMARVMQDVARYGLRVAHEGLRAARSTYAEGMMTRADLMEAEREVQRAESMVTKAGIGVQTAELALAQLLGHEPGTRLHLAAGEPRFSPLGEVDIAEKVRLALVHRYEMKEMDAMVELAKEHLDIAREYPASISPPWEDWFDGELPYPLPTGPETTPDEYVVPIARLEHREARLGHQLLSMHIENQVRTLYLAVLEGEQQVAEKRAALRFAHENHRRVALEFEEDMVTRLELMMAQLERMRCEAELAAAILEHESLKARFHHSYGPGSVEGDMGMQGGDAVGTGGFTGTGR